MIKPCRKCEADFEPKPHQIKSRRFVCPPCQRVWAKAWRLARKESGNPVISTIMPTEWNSEYQRQWRKREGVADHLAELAREYRKDPVSIVKNKARWTLRHAVDAGRVTKYPCEVCGDEKSEGHHDDYGEPLSVRWLCRTHHSEHHNERAKS